MHNYVSIKNLALAKISYKDENNEKMKFFIIGKYKKEKLTTMNAKIVDIFTGIEYKTDDYNITGNISYLPLSTIINNYSILKRGYIKKEFLFDLLCDLNNGLIEKREIGYTNASTKSFTDHVNLTEKKFEVEPTIGRKQEINNIITILASNKKNPILVGESGTGKSSIVEELAYLIQNDEVPRFLKNKDIVSISSSDLVAGSNFVGTMEAKFKELIEYVKKKNAILFIDEIHTAFGAGASSNDDNDLAELLKNAINNDNIKVIGATTREEYEKYFSIDALKRRFEVVKVEEPVDKNLNIIAHKVFNDYSQTIGISLDRIEDSLDKIIEILIELTKKEHRKYDDMVYNPDLIVTLIDTAFAKSRIEDRAHVLVDDIIYSVRNNSRLYDLEKEKSIMKLEKLNTREKQFVKKKSSNNVVKFNKK